GRANLSCDSSRNQENSAGALGGWGPQTLTGRWLADTYERSAGFSQPRLSPVDKNFNTPPAGSSKKNARIQTTLFLQALDVRRRNAVPTQQLRCPRNLGGHLRIFNPYATVLPGVRLHLRGHPHVQCQIRTDRLPDIIRSRKFNPYLALILLNQIGRQTERCLRCATRRESIGMNGRRNGEVEASGLSGQIARVCFLEGAVQQHLGFLLLR